ncbi:molybdopterin-binding protein [Halobacteria archaeon AArc-curdl1]|uniref:Molybdopterin-binding protein n=1 Tax=Natronosalvus hydrolyticus TaxID=2979988 RepID=A0AAP2Z5N8_9EURY|nr:molybdopterin-binding protein [Halobacteria archaeon AArc-curdl1]
MHVAIVTIGDELLAGRTTNTNATWLCSQLTERGVDVERVTTLPDRVADIARVVNEYHAEYDAVIVTGGLGPTHDDVTIEAIGAAFGRPLEEHEAVLEWLETEGGYAREDLTDGTAMLPSDARPLHNVAGVAPGCVIGSVYVFPGVPHEMKPMFEGVATEFSGQERFREVVVADEPESALLDRLAELQQRFDVGVGSYPGEHVRISVQSTDRRTVEEAVDWLRDQVKTVAVTENGDS